MFGWFRRRHEDKLRWSTDRTQILYALPENPREYLDPLSRQEVARRVEWLMEKFGIVKEGGAGIARHTIGTGLTLQMNSDDLEYNAAAEADFMLYSLTKSRFDRAGRRDLYTAQRTAVEQLIWRGEFFSAQVTNPNWDDAPCEQLFDTTEIATPDDLGRDDSIYDGVRLGDCTEPLGYFVKTTGGRFKEIPAQKMTHWYEPTGINQVRGESAFSPVVDKLVDWRDLEKLVIQGAKVHSALAVAVKKLAKSGRKGAFGAIRGSGSEGGTEGADTTALEKAFPGRVAYLGAEGDVSMVTSDSPNEKLEPFLTNLISPDVFLALGVPSEFFWAPNKLGGANTRFILSRADLRFKVLADDLIYTWLNGVAFRYLSWRIKQGILPEPKDPNWASKMGWQQPARITVDNGRDGSLELDQLENGVENLRALWDRRGKNYREEGIRQWLREWQEFLAEAESMKIPEWVQKKWRPGKPGAAAMLGAGESKSSKPEASPEDDTEDEEKKAA